MDDENEGLSIRLLSERTGCPLETIRFYERVGILDPSTLSPTGRRVYNSEHVRQLTFVRNARHLGFSLDRVRALLNLRAHPDDHTIDAKAITVAHLDETRRKLADLQRIASQLQSLTNGCAPDSLGPCPILIALDGGPGGAAVAAE